MLSQISGMKITVSRFAYKTKTVVRGIADSRRPNGKKPLYQCVAICIPLMYKIGNDIVCAPEWKARIRQAFQQTRIADVTPVSPESNLTAQWKEQAFSVGLRQLQNH